MYAPDASSIMISNQTIMRIGESLWNGTAYTMLNALIGINITTGAIMNGNNIGGDTTTPSNPLQEINLITADDVMTMYLNIATSFAAKDNANTFTEIQTFSKGIKIGSTTLDETTINIPTVDVDFDTIIPVEQRTYLQRDTIKFKIPSLGIDSVVAHLLKHSSGNTRDYYFAMVDENSNTVKTIVIRYDNSLIPQLIGNS